AGDAFASLMQADAAWRRRRQAGRYRKGETALTSGKAQGHMTVNIFCIGDVVGKPGRGILADHLHDYIRNNEIDLVVCNAENAAGGSGLTPQIFNKLLHYGVDVVTLGDHALRRREVFAPLEESDRLIRPANLSGGAVGRGWTVVETKSGQARVGVTCLLGQMYMNSVPNSDSPWKTIDAVLDEMPSDVRIRVVDFHAEASSEKIAMGWHCNGRMSAVFGTHTHIPTADARVLDGGTAYISDVGMTGPYDSVLGRRKDRVLQFLTTSMPAKFEVADGDVRISGLLASIDPETGRAISAEQVQICGRSEDADNANTDSQPAQSRQTGD
ncbi:MAG: TIGR00282 family metallophosphoesterase, partial [Planctomycetota bacterium]